MREEEREREKGVREVSMETGKSCCVFLSVLEREREVSHFVGEKVQED